MEKGSMQYMGDAVRNKCVRGGGEAKRQARGRGSVQQIQASVVKSAQPPKPKRARGSVMRNRLFSLRVQQASAMVHQRSGSAEGSEQHCRTVQRCHKEARQKRGSACSACGEGAARRDAARPACAAEGRRWCTRETCRQTRYMRCVGWRGDGEDSRQMRAMCTGGRHGSMQGSGGVALVAGCARWR